MPYIDISQSKSKSVKLHYQDFGEGPPVVLIHGWPLSGRTWEPQIADLVDAVYHQIVTVGTHKASSIKVAEAAKVIENTQRDVNIALINELALIFNKLGIDTEEVLKAAGTKWNFLH